MGAQKSQTSKDWAGPRSTSCLLSWSHFRADGLYCSPEYDQYVATMRCCSLDACMGDGLSMSRCLVGLSIVGLVGVALNGLNVIVIESFVISMSLNVIVMEYH